MVNAIRKIDDKKKLTVSVILNIITIIGFLITVGSFIFISGKKEARIEQLEKDVVTLKADDATIKYQSNLQTNEITDVNAKLDLLINHFHIVD